MKYFIKFDETDKICNIKVMGKLHRPDDSIAIQKLVRDYYHEKGCSRFLIDLRKAHIIKNTTDTFSIGTVPIDKDRKLKRIPHKVALVYANTSVDEIFLENVATKRGYNIKIFTKIDKAMEWIRKD
ncbi:MAG: STAS/SEC14 domain-containing protein [candidate division WOR-3 bacterium]